MYCQHGIRCKKELKHTPTEQDRERAHPDDDNVTMAKAKSAHIPSLSQQEYFVMADGAGTVGVLHVRQRESGDIIEVLTC
jgi:hypothetical protein